MGSGKSRQTRQLMNLYSIVDMQDPAEKKRYYDSHAENPRFNERAEEIIRRIESLPSSESELIREFRSAQLFYSFRDDDYLYRSYNELNGDIATVTESPLIQTSDYKRAFRALGGEVGNVATLVDVKNRFLDIYKGYLPMPENPAVRKVLSYTTDPDSYSSDGVPADAVLKGLINVGFSISPYFENPNTRGRLDWDIENSPTTSFNRTINKSIIATTRLGTELVTLFQQTFPSDNPITKINYGSQHFTNPKLSSASGFYNPSSRDITLNPLFLGNLRVKLEPFSLSSLGGGAPDTLIHEFGHSLHLYLSDRAQSGTDPAFRKIYQRYRDITEVNMRAQNDPINNLRLEAVSVYGNANKAEAFAEAFLMYTMGVEPKIGNEYFSMFKDFMREANLEQFHGVSSMKTNTIPKTTPVKPKTAEKTLVDTPQKTSSSSSLTFKIGFQKYTVKVTDKTLARGYIYKTVNNVKYKIDAKTGQIIGKKRL